MEITNNIIISCSLIYFIGENYACIVFATIASGINVENAQNLLAFGQKYNLLIMRRDQV